MSRSEPSSPLPASPNYHVKYHEQPRGRTIVASRDLATDTLLLATRAEACLSQEAAVAFQPDLIAHVIRKEYRREVCAWCFAYDRGRAWKIRDHWEGAGVVFCSDPCKEKWILDITIQNDSESAACTFKKTNHSGPYLGLQAHEAVWRLVKKHSAKRAQQSNSDTANEAFNRKGDDFEGLSETGKKHRLRPTSEEIEAVWHKTENEIAPVIRRARSSNKPTKAENRALRNILDDPEDAAEPDILSLFLAGILWAYRYSISVHAEKRGQADPYYEDCSEAITIPRSLSSLAPDTQPYPTRVSLRAHTNAYLQLLAILPLALLDATGASLCHGLVARASWNAFGLRPTEQSQRWVADGGSFCRCNLGDKDDDNTQGLNSMQASRHLHLTSSQSTILKAPSVDGGELLGWGVWPAASFFNHSCAPNVMKWRRGRHWVFCATQTAPDDKADARKGGESSLDCNIEDDRHESGLVHGHSDEVGVKKDEELCISYLGGDEKELTVTERCNRLWEGWGFWCHCSKCRIEARLS